MGGRIAKQVRKTLAVSVVALIASCGADGSGSSGVSSNLATCVKVCEKEKSCIGPPQEGRNCERFCTRQGADAPWFGLGSAGVSSSCNSDDALARLNACVDRGCADLENCEACVCGDLSRCQPDFGTNADGGG